MPILVQWKWQEKTKTYLVIFHFYDDFSHPNLRLKKRKLEWFHSNTKQLMNAPITEISSNSSSEIGHKETSILTWAPSHTEIALLGDLLHYANIIGGLSEGIRRDLRYDLEITVVDKDLDKNEWAMDEKRIADLDRRFRNPSVFFGYDLDKEGSKNAFFCLELSPEYIDYLREILKPYM